MGVAVNPFLYFVFFKSIYKSVPQKGREEAWVIVHPLDRHGLKQNTAYWEWGKASQDTHTHTGNKTQTLATVFEWLNRCTSS